MVWPPPPHHDVLHVRAVPRPPGAAVSAQEPAALAPREHDDSIALAIRAAFDHEGSSGSGIRSRPLWGAGGRGQVIRDLPLRDQPIPSMGERLSAHYGRADELGPRSDG